LRLCVAPTNAGHYDIRLVTGAREYVDEVSNVRKRGALVT
jgi:hypothetical protein